MPAFDNTGKIGAFLVAATDRILAAMNDYSRHLGSIQLDRAVEEPASHVVFDLHIGAVGADGSVTSVPFRAPFPLRILEIQAGASHGAGVTGCTVDVLVSRAPTHGSATSILVGATADAVPDGVPLATVCEDGEQDLAFNDRVSATVATAGGAAGVTGAYVKLVCQRL